MCYVLCIHMYMRHTSYVLWVTWHVCVLALYLYAMCVHALTLGLQDGRDAGCVGSPGTCYSKETV